MVAFEAERLKDVAALKAKIKSLEGENADLKKNQVSLQNILQTRESELKNQQGIISLPLLVG
jgi:DNA anti-recombination protein RmuC